MADAVVADGAAPIHGPPQRFDGADHQHVGMSAEANQNVGRVSLGELEHRPVRRGDVVEHSVHPSPVGLGHLLPRNV